MNLDRLRYFSSVAATGSITRAAELLSITQPALSNAMRQLERELGVPLLRRQGRGVELTEAGIHLAIRIRPLLDDLAAIPDELATRLGAARPLRYASHETFGTYFVRLLLDRDPDLFTEHRFALPGGIEQAVADGVSDLGITYIPVPTSGVQHERVGQIPMGVFGAARWLDTPFDDWRFAAPVLPPTGAAVGSVGLDGWPDDRIQRDVRWRVTHTETGLELCRQGRSVGCFSAFVVDLHNEHAAPERRLHPMRADGIPTRWLQPVFLITREHVEHLDGADLLRAVVESLSESE